MGIGSSREESIVPPCYRTAVRWAGGYTLGTCHRYKPCEHMRHREGVQAGQRPDPQIGAGQETARTSTTASMPDRAVRCCDAPWPRCALVPMCADRDGCWWCAGRDGCWSCAGRGGCWWCAGRDVCWSCAGRGGCWWCAGRDVCWSCAGRLCPPNPDCRWLLIVPGASGSSGLAGLIGAVAQRCLKYFIASARYGSWPCSVAE
jgi:hypothetical protein